MTLKSSFIFLIVLAFLYSCGENKTSTTDNNKVEKPSDTKTTSTETNKTTTSEGIKLAKITTVEASGEKMTSPNFSWDENGKTVSMNDLKGKVVMVNLWATWCGPCIKEMPDLSAISQELEGKDFRLIGLNVFQQPTSKKVEDFLKTMPLSYWVVDGNEDVVKAFSTASGSEISAVPTTFIINKDGKIVETIIGSRDKGTFRKMIDKYL